MMSDVDLTFYLRNNDDVPLTSTSGQRRCPVDVNVRVYTNDTSYH